MSSKTNILPLHRKKTNLIAKKIEKISHRMKSKSEKRKTNNYIEIGSEIEHPFHFQIAKANKPPPNFDKVKKETEEIKSQTNPELNPQQMGKEMMDFYKA